MFAFEPEGHDTSIRTLAIHPPVTMCLRGPSRSMSLVKAATGFRRPNIATNRHMYSASESRGCPCIDQYKSEQIVTVFPRLLIYLSVRRVRAPSSYRLFIWQTSALCFSVRKPPILQLTHCQFSIDNADFTAYQGSGYS